jgi:hypothetical protein
MARRTFIELSMDTKLLSEFDPRIKTSEPVKDGAALLSAILFLDLETERFHLFFNPRAKNSIPWPIEDF